MTPPIDELTGSKGKLIMATVDLIASRGFESTSVQEILDAAQVTKSNFYYHFKSKEDLCLATVEVMEEYYFANMLTPTLLNKGLSPKERLKALFKVMQNKMEHQECKQGCPFSNLASETSDFHPEFRQRISGFYQKQAKIIEECIEEGIAQGEFRADISPPEMSNMILSTMNGTMLLAKAYRNANVLQQNADLLFQLISRI
jgi:TetR/AcrR family transcriptional regulator, transcriptional repressor for nem operon